LVGVFFVLFPKRVLRLAWIDQRFLALVGLRKWMPDFFYSPLWVRLNGLVWMAMGLLSLRAFLFEA
jgi:hypothetical protein